MRRPEKASPRGWLRIYQPAWWSLAVVVGTVGVAGVWFELGPGGALLLLTGFTLLATFGVWQFGPQHGDGRPRRPAVLLGTACSLGFLTFIGLGYELGPVGLAVGTAVAGAGWPLLRHRPSTPGREPARTTPDPSPDPPAGPPLECLPAAPLPDVSALHGLSTSELCWTWRAGYVCLRRYPWPSYLECIADVRRGCLDELERRDPVAFAHWFPTARAASDPARYFCRQSQR